MNIMCVGFVDIAKFAKTNEFQKILDMTNSKIKDYLPHKDFLDYYNNLKNSVHLIKVFLYNDQNSKIDINIKVIELNVVYESIRRIIRDIIESDNNRKTDDILEYIRYMGHIIVLGELLKAWKKYEEKSETLDNIREIFRVDVCYDPIVSDINSFEKYFSKLEHFHVCEFLLIEEDLVCAIPINDDDLNSPRLSGVFARDLPHSLCGKLGLDHEIVLKYKKRQKCRYFNFKNLMLYIASNHKYIEIVLRSYSSKSVNDTILSCPIGLNDVIVAKVFDVLNYCNELQITLLILVEDMCKIMPALSNHIVCHLDFFDLNKLTLNNLMDINYNISKVHLYLSNIESTENLYKMLFVFYNFLINKSCKSCYIKIYENFALDNYFTDNFDVLKSYILKMPFDDNVLELDNYQKVPNDQLENRFNFSISPSHNGLNINHRVLPKTKALIYSLKDRIIASDLIEEFLMNNNKFIEFIQEPENKDALNRFNLGENFDGKVRKKTFQSMLKYFFKKYFLIIFLILILMITLIQLSKKDRHVDGKDKTLNASADNVDKFNKNQDANDDY